MEPETTTAYLHQPWAVTEEKVWIALQRLIDAADPVKIIAFGSRARGAARENSDLDLAVILDPSSSLKPGMHLWSLFSDLRLPVDLIVAEEPQHELFSSSINSVHHAIKHEGVTLYQKGANGRPSADVVAKISH